MAAADLPAVAERNLQRHLRENPYPGRGLIVGRSADGAAWLQVYWIMGRSENSRNRRFVVDGSSMRTEAVDPAKLSDPTNVIYEAILELPDLYVVGNGDQTRTIVEALAAGGSFEDALATREREDDAPNYTPRISGLLDLRGHMHGVPPRVAISILRAADADAAQSDRITTRPALPPPGLGLGITTYAGDGDPLPPFRGDPLWLPLAGGAGHVLATYWDALDAGNRVALAVKTIPVGAGPGQHPRPQRPRRLSGIRGRPRALDQRPGVRSAPLGRLREDARLQDLLGPAAQRGALGRVEVLRQRRPQRGLRAQLRQERLHVGQQWLGHRLAGVVPDHGAQLVLDVERERVVDAPDRAVARPAKRGRPCGRRCSSASRRSPCGASRRRARRAVRSRCGCGRWG